MLVRSWGKLNLALPYTVDMRSLVRQLRERSGGALLFRFLGREGVVLFLLPLAALALSFSLRPNFLVSILLFLGLPSAYLAFRYSKYVLKVSLFSLIASLPLMVILEYVGGLSMSWAFPPSSFHFQLFGRVYMEVLLWAFLNIFAAVMFYEAIFENHRRVSLWNKNMWVLVRYLSVWIGLFFLAWIITDGSISLPYFYLLFGIILFLYPILMTWLYYPRILHKIAYTTLYFSYLSLLYEITALKMGWWYFPGNEFIGYISLLDVTFPLEEFLFWIVLFAPAVVCAYEYLDDDHR